MTACYLQTRLDRVQLHRILGEWEGQDHTHAGRQQHAAIMRDIHEAGEALWSGRKGERAFSLFHWLVLLLDWVLACLYTSTCEAVSSMCHDPCSMVLSQIGV